MWKCIFYDFVKSYHHRFQFYCYHNISAKRFQNPCVGKFSKYLVFLQTFTNKSPNAHILREKCPNSEFFVVRINSKCGKIRTRKTLNTGTFHYVIVTYILHLSSKINTDLKEECSCAFRTQSNI